MFNLIIIRPLLAPDSDVTLTYIQMFLFVFVSWANGKRAHWSFNFLFYNAIKAFISVVCYYCTDVCLEIANKLQFSSVQFHSVLLSKKASITPENKFNVILLLQYLRDRSIIWALSNRVPIGRWVHFGRSADRASRLADGADRYNAHNIYTV